MEIILVQKNAWREILTNRFVEENHSFSFLRGNGPTHHGVPNDVLILFGRRTAHCSIVFWVWASIPAVIQTISEVSHYFCVSLEYAIAKSYGFFATCRRTLTRIHF